MRSLRSSRMPSTGRLSVACGQRQTPRLIQTGGATYSVRPTTTLAKAADLVKIVERLANGND